MIVLLVFIILLIVLNLYVVYRIDELWVFVKKIIAYKEKNVDSFHLSDE